MKVNSAEKEPCQLSRSPLWLELPLVIALGVVLLPLGSCSFPPSVDGPLHLRHALALSNGGDEFFALRSVSWFAPYQLFYRALAPLTNVSTTFAGFVVCIIEVAGLALAANAILHSGRKPSSVERAASLFVLGAASYTHLYYLGFWAFSLALPLVFILAWRRLEGGHGGAWTDRLLLLGIYFLHPLALGMAFVAILAVRPQGEGRRSRWISDALAVLLLLCTVAFLRQTRVDGGAPVSVISDVLRDLTPGALAGKCSFFVTSFFQFRSPLGGVFCLSGVAFALLGAGLGEREPFDGPILRLLVGNLALVLLLPFFLMGAAFVNTRFLGPLQVLGLVALLRARPPRAMIAKAAWGFAGVLLLGGAIHSHWQYEKSWEAVRPIVERMEPGKRIRYYDPQRNPVAAHAAQRYVMAKGGQLPGLFPNRLIPVAQRGVFLDVRHKMRVLADGDYLIARNRSGSWPEVIRTGFVLKFAAPPWYLFVPKRAPKSSAGR